MIIPPHFTKKKVWQTFSFNYGEIIEKYSNFFFKNNNEQMGKRFFCVFFCFRKVALIALPFDGKVMT
jgi:hypothetical protein